MERGKRRAKQGRVVSDKMDKTVVVLVERRVPHKLYRKIVTKRSKFVVHDPESRCQLGDMVQIVETRPLSKTKRWRVTKVVRKAE
ncbi:30S ribosomal protein S17 [candidate division TA06 bacterium]|uniref:Small ribosomal subunit protein uS17 n=2 Tax=candidate division TA06 bacterium TaxID=2250710 RepID=A0A523UWV7_UNCT6|nr:MAG: 30S ribosomal protein S17 [candidate division TA06 bacterium]